MKTVYGVLDPAGLSIMQIKQYAMDTYECLPECTKGDFFGIKHDMTCPRRLGSLFDYVYTQMRANGLSEKSAGKEAGLLAEKLHKENVGFSYGDLRCFGDWQKVLA